MKITTAGGEAMSRPGSGDIDSISSSKSKENTRQKAADSSQKSDEFSLFLLNLRSRHYSDEFGTAALSKVQETHTNHKQSEL